MAEGLQQQKEIYTKYPDIPVKTLIHRLPQRTNSSVYFNRLLNSSIIPFRVESIENGTHYVCLFAQPFSSEVIFNMANEIAPHPYGFPVEAAVADIDMVDEVDRYHKGIMKKGYLGPDQKDAFRRMEAGFSETDDLEMRFRPNLHAWKNEFRDMVIERIASGNRDYFKYDLTPDMSVIGHPGFASQFSILFQNKLLFHYHFHQVLRDLVESNYNSKKVRFPSNLFNNEDFYTRERASSYDLVPALVVDPNGVHTPITAVYNTRGIEAQGQQILLDNIIRSPYEIPLELKIAPGTVSSICGPLMLGLLDDRFYQELQKHPHLSGSGVDNRNGQDMMALQTVLLSHFLLDKQFKKLHVPTGKIPFLQNLFTRLSVSA